MPDRPEDLLRQWTDYAPAEEAMWDDPEPGPSVAEVAARLSSAPRPFLEPEASVPALANDILGGVTARGMLTDRTSNETVLRGAALGLWLFASEGFVGPFAPPLSRNNPGLAVDALGFRLAPVSDPLGWLADAERREEAARTFLLWNGQLPAGEDVITARGALAARDSLQFNKALADSVAEHRHRLELTRRLEEARAREAAARYTRE